MTKAYTNRTLKHYAGNPGVLDYDQQRKGSFSTYLTNVDKMFSETANGIDDDFEKEKKEYAAQLKGAVADIADTLSQISAQALQWREGTHTESNEAVVETKLLRLDELVKEMNFKVEQVEKVSKENWEDFKTETEIALVNWQKESSQLIREIKEMIQLDIKKS